MTPPNSHDFLPPMEEIAREAGALLMDYFRQRVTVEYKGEADLVTVADRKSELLIRERLHERWPSFDILGEEGGLQDTGSDYRWYVDPLDGTTNFAHGFPVFCVSMGLDYKGERIAGVIYDPTRDELFSAEKGGGAFLNQQPIRVSKVSRLAECLVATGFPSHKRHKNPNIFFYHQITLHTHGVRRAGSAALDLCYVASGRLDGFWEFNLNPWDTAAGVLMVQEAGGTVSNFKGGPFQLDSRETLASNGLVHEQLLNEIEQVFSGNDLEPLPDLRSFRK
ncbi:MAG TPA: inositol monophosphatase family protein [Terriglobales bacterium]|jgi:myo-inositol-1(or 4)-monophosphatase|nr:inositol monophosphatase family protein [Terriglobales bacterium]